MTNLENKINIEISENLKLIDTLIKSKANQDLIISYQTSTLFLYDVLTELSKLK